MQTKTEVSTTQLQALWPYQQAVYLRAMDEIARGKNPLIVMPTASGKTHVLVEMIAEFKKTLTLAHRVELAEKAARLLQQRAIDVGRITAGTDLNLDIPCQVGTIASLMARKCLSTFAPNIVFVDEAHRIRCPSYAKVSDYCKVKKIPIVGFTATPTRLDGLFLGAVFDEIIEGPSVSWLIENNYISNVRVYVPSMGAIDMDKVSTLGGEYVKSEVKKRAVKRELVASAVQEWQGKAQGRQTIVFTTGQEHSEMVQSEYAAIGIDARIVDGKLTAKVRSQLLGDFKSSQFPVLVACQIPIEGTDIPCCEVIQCLRPTLSLVYWWQMIGRALRKSENDAIVLDHAGNSYKLGLPNQDIIEWTLTGAQAPEAEVKICSQCGQVLNQSCLCKGSFEAIGHKTRSLPQLVDGRLILFNRFNYDYELIDNLIKGKKKNKEIIDIVGCSLSTICIRRKELGLQKSKNINYVLMDKLIKKKKENKEIAKIVGCAIGTVLSRRKSLGIPSLNINYELIDQMIKEGMGNKEIAKIIKCSTTPIVNRRKVLDIPVLDKKIDYKLMDRLIKEKKGNKEISALMSCSETAIVVRRKTLGILSPGRINYKLMDRLIVEGKKNKEISEVFACHELTIARRRKRINKKCL